MSTKEKQNDSDPRITIAQMNQAWSDIRSYTSNIWQIAALCLTVIALSLNVVYTSTLVEPLLFLIILFTSLFAAGGVLAIQSLRYNITYRIVYIQEVEEKLVEIQEEFKVTPSLNLFGLERFPLKFLFGVLLFTTEALFIILAAVFYLFLISLSIEPFFLIVFAIIIFPSSFIPSLWYVVRKEKDLRRRERESASDWKDKFRDSLLAVIDKLKMEGHTIEFVYGFSIFDRDRESDVNIIVKSDVYEFTFITRTSYWVSKKLWSDARAFENQVIFIVTPHHERFPKQRFRVFTISSAVSSKDLRKYLLDGLAGKLFDVNDNSLES